MRTIDLSYLDGGTVVAHAETASGTLRTVRNAAGLRDILGSRQRPAGARTPARPWDRWLLAAIYSGLNHANVRLRLWDGTSCGLATVSARQKCHSRTRTRRAPTPADPVATVVIHDRAALFSLAWQPDIAFGDGYAAGRIDVDGDLVALLEALLSRQARRRRSIAGERAGCAACSSRRTRSVNRATTSITTTTSATSSTACGSTVKWSTRAPTSRPRVLSSQRREYAKMDLVCRKLNLQPGERVVEAGCGWGSLALHMARHYRVKVKAFNVSARRIRFCAGACGSPEGLTTIAWSSSRTTIATFAGGLRRMLR